MCFFVDTYQMNPVDLLDKYVVLILWLLKSDLYILMKWDHLGFHTH